MRRIFPLLLALSLLLTACGGAGDAAEDSAPAVREHDPNAVSITIFNSKSEIQSQMDEMAAEYSREKGVNVDVYYSSDTVAAHLSSRYAARDPYTLMMVDAKDIYSMGEEFAVDLSDEPWVDDTDYEIAINGAVYGFPVCVEARGLMYNATVIEEKLGRPFVPEDYATLESFKGLLEELKANGLAGPTGIMKEDWSLAAHFLAEVYEEREDRDGFINALHAGTADLKHDPKFNSLMDAFDVLKENNYYAKAAVAAEREVSEWKLAEGGIAFMFGGNWDWSMLSDFDYTDGLGMMPVPQDTDDGSNTMLVGGGSKYFYIDKSPNTTEEQRQAAKDFLNWLVYDPAGNAFLSQDCALVPAYSNIEAVGLDPLGVSVKKYADANALIGNYDYLPDDHYAKLGASMQKYVANVIDRDGLVAEIEAYWRATTPVAH